MRLSAFLTLIAGTCFGQGFGIDPVPFPINDARPLAAEIPSSYPASTGTLPYAYPVPRAGTARLDVTAVHPQHAFVIAFKDRTLDSALKCWVNGRTLHYVNLRNEPRAVAMNRVDWKYTRTMNPGIR